MIKENKVLVSINLRNLAYYKNEGYQIDLLEKSLEVSIDHLHSGSGVRITAICEICGSENQIQYKKYLVNKNRNDKGFYSCFKCKNIEKEKTCIKKFGVKSYSQTDEFRKTESKKWKGKRKGGQKYIDTMIRKYGVDCYFKTKESKESNRVWMSSEEFRMRAKDTILKKWGVDHFSKTDDFKNKIIEKKELILEKIKKTFQERWGEDWISKTEHFKYKMKEKKEETVRKIKATCLEKYGVDNVSKVKEVAIESRKTKEELGLIIPDELLSEWFLYKRDVRRLTNRSKKKLYELWDGYDKYDGEFIKGYLAYSHTHRFYPTVDHKISVYFGFMNALSAEEVSSIENLCITKRFINSKKKVMTDSEFTSFLPSSS